MINSLYFQEIYMETFRIYFILKKCYGILVHVFARVPYYF